MGDGKQSGDGKTSPFGNGNGGGSSMAANGAHDFVTQPTTTQGKTAPARDFSKESRPQSAGKPEVEPNPQEIPAGGKVLKADPGPVSRSVSGAAPGPQPPRPFKLKG